MIIPPVDDYHRKRAAARAAAVRDEMDDESDQIDLLVDNLGTQG